MIGAIVLSVFDDIDTPKYHENPPDETRRTRTDISQKFHGECFAPFIYFGAITGHTFVRAGCTLKTGHSRSRLPDQSIWFEWLLIWKSAELQISPPAKGMSQFRKLTENSQILTFFASGGVMREPFCSTIVFIALHCSNFSKLQLHDSILTKVVTYS